MPVNLSIKNVPDELAQRLRERAARNHRSVQGELMALIEAAAGSELMGNEFGDERRAYRAEERLSASEVLAWAREQGIRTEGKSVVDMIREDRDRETALEKFERMRKLDPLKGGESAAGVIRKIRDGGPLPEPRGKLNAREISERIRKLGLTSKDEAVRMIREDRDR